MHIHNYIVEHRYIYTHTYIVLKDVLIYRWIQWAAASHVLDLPYVIMYGNSGCMTLEQWGNPAIISQAKFCMFYIRWYVLLKTYLRTNYWTNFFYFIFHGTNWLQTTKLEFTNYNWIGGYLNKGASMQIKYTSTR